MREKKLRTTETLLHTFSAAEVCVMGVTGLRVNFLPVYMILINKNLLDMVLDGMEKQKFIIKNH